MLQNAYFVAKIGADTAENEQHFAEILQKLQPCWRPWSRSDQGLQQGGAFVFEGDKLLFQHYDPSTGAHVDLDELLQTAVIQ